MRIAIIGSGSSAFAAAIYAAEKGAEVVMIEKGLTGGTCVNVGCVPSKIFIRAAHVAHTQQAHAFQGIAKQVPIIQRKLLLEQQQNRVAELREAKYESVLASNPSISFVHGTAKFKDKNTLIVHTGNEIQTITADRILIATGSSPHIPDIKGLKDTPFWTSTEALQSETLPEHLIILGGSIVAVELAQAFLRLGTKVTLLARSTLLSKEDPQIGLELQKVFEDEGMRVLTHTVPQQVQHDGEKFVLKTDKETIVGDRLLVATGRYANTPTLALENVGVKTDAVGSIVVDPQMRTNVDTIYASGDCTNQPQYVYVAAAAGTRAAMNMLGKNVALDLSLVPSVVFTDPQVATVGLTETQARAIGIEIESRTLGMENVPRALANFDTRGFIKLVTDKKTKRIIGAHILAAEGGEMIQTAMLAISTQMTVNKLASYLFPYLTMAEGLKLCAQIFSKDVKKLSCCADTGDFEEEAQKEVQQLSHLKTGESASSAALISSFSSFLSSSSPEASSPTTKVTKNMDDCCAGSTEETVDDCCMTTKPGTTHDCCEVPKSSL